ncbi:hypothetical protein [Clostridium sp.]|uniref:hypothetical protein n=1 Tax=Clostridium sp. TaxID=1506 RepID=UPI003217D9F6
MKKILTMENLEMCFRLAKARKQNYIGIKVSVPNSKEDEVIINPNANFDNKLEYYKKAYNDNLTLKSFNQIRITGFTYGNSYGEIENDLITG